MHMKVAVCLVALLPMSILSLLLKAIMAEFYAECTDENRVAIVVFENDPKSLVFTLGTPQIPSSNFVDYDGIEMNKVSISVQHGNRVKVYQMPNPPEPHFQGKNRNLPHTPCGTHMDDTTIGSSPAPAVRPKTLSRIPNLLAQPTNSSIQLMSGEIVKPTILYQSNESMLIDKPPAQPACAYTAILEEMDSTIFYH